MAAKTFDEWWNDPETIEGLDGYHNEECSQAAWNAAIASMEGVRERAPNTQSRAICADFISGSKCIWGHGDCALAACMSVQRKHAGV